MKHILVLGNLTEGFSFVGPFDQVEDLHKWALSHHIGDYENHPIELPEQSL